MRTARHGVGPLLRLLAIAVLAALLATPAAAQMPDLSQMNGRSLPAPDAPSGSATVRVMRETLGNNLLRCGTLSREVLAESRQQAEQSGKRHGEILVAMQALSEEQVADALRAQADELRSRIQQQLLDAARATPPPTR